MYYYFLANKKEINYYNYEISSAHAHTKRYMCQEMLKKVDIIKYSCLSFPTVKVNLMITFGVMCIHAFVKHNLHTYMK